jgi:putative transposase
VPEVRDQRSEVSNPGASPPRPKGLVCSDSGPSSRIRTNQQPSPFASLAPLRFNNKPLAEKTIEDLLPHFGETQKVARRRYREFVEKGIAQGRRPEFQGGGLVRSAGGNKAGLLGRSKEEREKGDARILGSGDFVMQALDKANEIFERGFNRPISLDELTRRVTKDKGVDLKELISSKRTQKISDTRAIISYLAGMELRNSGKEIAEYLQLSEKSVSRCIGRGKKLFDNDERLLDYIQ